MTAEQQEVKSNPVRLALVIGAILFWCLFLCIRLGCLQILQHEDFVQQALQQQQVTRNIVAPRGIIYDAHMDELAANVSVNTVVAEPRRIEKSKLEWAARQLASILGLEFDKLYARMKDPKRQSFLVIKRRIDPKAESRIEALGLDGVYLVEESMRVYPNRELACQTLGFVNRNNDGEGAAGIEMQYDKELKGVQGQISFDIDAHRRSFRGEVVNPPIQGHSLVLSLDKSIQYIAERELAAGVSKYNAISGTAIVMESDTGRILAMAGVPNFNSNTYNEVSPDLYLNRAVSEFVEPGSTFKVVVAAAALEEGATRPDDMIDCQMGAIRISGHVFHDHKPYGVLRFGEILEFSSNIGAAILGERLGKERLYGYLRRFGFGTKTGIDVPGEIIGLVRDVSKWSGLSVPTISFGQEVGVTSIQILDAINAIANGGYLVKPSIVDRIIDQNGNLISVHSPQKTRIMKSETADTVREAFEGVVLRGTGKKAALDGYRAAGKTGTAQKIVHGQYSDTKYVASFIGFAPLPNPKITVLVQINEPNSAIYGGDVSAPIFRAIAQGALMQLGIPPDQPLPLAPSRVNAASRMDVADYRPDATPAPVKAEKPDDKGKNEPEEVRVLMASDSITLPDFSGMSKRTVAERGNELGIRIQTAGTGTAITQIPPAGTQLALGETCIVTFSVNKPARGPRIALPAQGNLAAVRRQESVKR
jgi:cell division protein FtsI (penicillin-binding protein 3)